MYNKLYDNCFKTELNTKVIKVQEENGMFWHACKDTIFYKESGGMASDSGMIDRHTVYDLKWQDGELWHLLDVKLEGAVYMNVNPHDRFRKCQIHTAQHLISALMKNAYRVDTLAHHVSVEENDIEFNIDHFTEKMAFELQVLCNGLIRDDLNVNILYPTKTEAMGKLPKEKVMMDDLRVVRIGALDYNPCGCMHVPSLRYLQMVFINGFEKTSKGYKIKYLVGDQLLDCVSKRYEVLNEASNTLSLSHMYLNSGINHLINENRHMHHEVNEWKTKYYTKIGDEMGRSSSKVIVQIFDQMDTFTETMLANYITKEYEKVVIFVAKNYDNVHVIVARNENVNFDVKSAFDRIAEHFGLKGGGNDKMYQGGGIYNEQMAAYLEEFIK